MLTRRQVGAVLDLAAELAEVENATAFMSAATAGLQAALDVDVTAYCEWHPRAGASGRVVLAPEQVDASLDQTEVWKEHHRQDLWIRHVTTTGSPHATRLTELASSLQLSRSPTYQGCYRPSGFRFMAHLPLSLDPDTSAAVGIGRGSRDLDDDVMALFEGLRAPLAGARRRLLQAGRPPQLAPVNDVSHRVAHMWVVRGRVGTADRQPIHPRPLTGRQADVLALVAEGFTNVQIGRRLGLSPRTVKKHLEAIFARLGVASRAAAAARWSAAQERGGDVDAASAS